MTEPLKRSIDRGSIPGTTKLYDRTDTMIAIEEVERTGF